MVQSSIVFVNTRNIVPQDQANQNNVVVNLDEPIFVPEDHDCMLSVNQAQIPNSFYSFNEPLIFNVRWSGITFNITATSARDGWITVNSKNNLFIGQTINVGAGTAFGGLTASTSYVITDIDPSANRIKLQNFTPINRQVVSIVGASLAVVSFNHIARTITLNNATDIQVGDKLNFPVGYGYSLPYALDYYVISKAGNVLTIADRPGGNALYPSVIPGINMDRIAAASIQVIDVNPTTNRLQMGRVVGLTQGETITFTASICGIVAGTSYTIRTIYPDTKEIDINTGGSLLDLTDSTTVGVATVATLNDSTGSIGATASSTQRFVIDTRVSAPATDMPGGAYALDRFQGGTNAPTNALHGKTLSFTNGITSTLTLSCTVSTQNATSQLTTKPGLVPKITMTFSVSTGTLANFTIENFTNYTLGFDNQTIVGTGTEAHSQPMFSPRYILIGSSLRTPGQVPGGRIRFNPIATIPMQVVFGSVQSYIPPFPSEQKIDDQVIRSFTLQVYDELGQLLNFNGVEWQAVLEFKMVPKRKPEYKYSW